MSAGTLAPDALDEDEILDAADLPEDDVDDYDVPLDADADEDEDDWIVFRGGISEDGWQRELAVISQHRFESVCDVCTLLFWTEAGKAAFCGCD